MVKKILPVAIVICLLANIEVMAEQDGSDKWQFVVDSVGTFSGSIVIANAFGPTTSYVLSDSKTTFTIQVREGAKRHSISLKNNETARRCNGLISIGLNEDGLSLVEGEVSCGKMYRPEQDSNVRLSGSFKVNDK